MSNPNLIDATSILGKTAVQNVATSATSIATNSLGSNKVLKVNTLYITNIDGTTSFEVTADIYRDSIPYRFVSTIAIPADSSLDVISKSFYLEEGDSLRLTANVANKLQAICSYEEIG